MKRSTAHPGAHLADQLSALNISAAELGRQLNVPGNRISGIVNGQRGITADTALRLGHFFTTDPEFWLNLQMHHDLDSARDKAGAAIKKLPTLESWKRGSP